MTFSFWVFRMLSMETSTYFQIFDLIRSSTTFSSFTGLVFLDYGNHVGFVKYCIFTNQYVFTHTLYTWGWLKIQCDQEALTIHYVCIAEWITNSVTETITWAMCLSSLVSSRLAYGCNGWRQTSIEISKLSPLYNCTLRSTLQNGCQEVKLIALARIILIEPMWTLLQILKSGTVKTILFEQK